MFKVDKRGTRHYLFWRPSEKDEAKNAISVIIGDDKHDLSSLYFSKLRGYYKFTVGRKK